MTTAKAQRLDAQVCFAMHTAVRAFDGVYRTLLHEHGLSYPQYIALMALGEAGDAGGGAANGSLTVGELGERMHLDSGTLSPLLKRMEAAGIVERRRDPADERRVLVTLTSAGRTRLAALSGVPRAIARQSGLTRAQLVELKQTLEDVTAALDAMPTD